MIDILVFDSTDTQRLQEQDFIHEDYGCWPDPPLRYQTKRRDGLGIFYLSDPVWDWEMPVPELRRQLDGLRRAVLLPLSDEYLTLLRQMLTLAEDAARRRWAARQTPKASTDQWESADLLSEVQSVCGEGRRVGAQWWFHCPFHQDDTPSLHVEEVGKRWYAFCCGKGGGVYDWRREIGR